MCSMALLCHFQICFTFLLQLFSFFCFHIDINWWCLLQFSYIVRFSPGPKFLLISGSPFQFAGIGYFTLPFLVHAGAEFLHACEWNPEAVKALARNLSRNGVSQSRYAVSSCPLFARIPITSFTMCVCGQSVYLSLSGLKQFGNAIVRTQAEQAKKRLPENKKPLAEVFWVWTMKCFMRRVMIKSKVPQVVTSQAINSYPNYKKAAANWVGFFSIQQWWNEASLTAMDCGILKNYHGFKKHLFLQSLPSRIIATSSVADTLPTSGLTRRIYSSELVFYLWLSTLILHSFTDPRRRQPPCLP